MKKILLFVLTLSGFCSFAQKSSVKLQVGYGVPLAGNAFPNIYSGNQNTQNNVTGSLGSGLTLEAGYTYSFAPLISAQMDLTYLAGNGVSGSYNDGVSYSDEKYTSSFFQVAPLIRFDVGDGKIHPYVAVGPVFAFGSMTDKQSGSGDGSYEQEIKYDGSSSVGTKSILGLELTKGNLGFFVQATMINMSYAPGKSEVTKYYLNGQDALSGLSTYNKIN